MVLVKSQIVTATVHEGELTDGGVIALETQYVVRVEFSNSSLYVRSSRGLETYLIVNSK